MADIDLKQKQNQTGSGQSLDPAYPRFASTLPSFDADSGRYGVRFARSREDLDLVLKLRFGVFNLEMNEGLDASYATQRDRDEYDATCHHLMVTERKTNQVVGTYRMQTREMACAADGFYSAEEFDLGMLPGEFMDHAVELGRACIAKPHRNGRVLFLLWKGLAAYMAANQKRYFFGCCSLTSQDLVEGCKVMNLLRSNGHVHPTLRTRPQPGFECNPGGEAVAGPEGVSIPKLMRLYLEYGAQISGPPAIDRLFKTIDFLAVFDLEQMDPRIHSMFFE